MTKKELIEFIADKADLTKVDAGKAVDAFVEGVTKGLKSSGKVTLVGFGTFGAKKRAGRKGVNPLTGKPMTIPERTVASFKAGSKLKEELN